MPKVRHIIVVMDNGEFFVPKKEQEIYRLAEEMLDEKDT